MSPAQVPEYLRSPRVWFYGELTEQDRQDIALIAHAFLLVRRQQMPFIADQSKRPSFAAVDRAIKDADLIPIEELERLSGESP